MDEELEAVWAGKKTAKEGLDAIVKRGTSSCASSSARTGSRRLSGTGPRARRAGGPPAVRARAQARRLSEPGAALPAGGASDRHHPRLLHLAGGPGLFQSLLLQDAFGLSTRFVWFENFERLFGDPYYPQAFSVTVIFSAATGLALGSALLLAVMADRVLRGGRVQDAPDGVAYAIAPVVAGVLWLFMFNPTVGIIAYLLRGLTWNHQLNGPGAPAGDPRLGLEQISYNFLFFLAGLQAIPKAVIEAPRSTAPAPAGASGGSSSRCCRRRPSSWSW